MTRAGHFICLIALVAVCVSSCQKPKESLLRTNPENPDIRAYDAGEDSVVTVDGLGVLSVDADTFDEKYFIGFEKQTAADFAKDAGINVDDMAYDFAMSASFIDMNYDPYVPKKTISVDLEIADPAKLSSPYFIMGTSKDSDGKLIVNYISKDSFSIAYQKNGKKMLHIDLLASNFNLAIVQGEPSDILDESIGEIDDEGKFKSSK